MILSFNLFKWKNFILMFLDFLYKDNILTCKVGFKDFSKFKNLVYREITLF